jgi:hypothetical protein
MTFLTAQETIEQTIPFKIIGLEESWLTKARMDES